LPGVHAATAEQFGVAEGLLRHLLENPEQAAIDERMKPLLAYVKKQTYTPSRMLPGDAEAVFAAGWNEQALHDAVSVCGLFNLMNRLVDGLGVTGDAAYFKLASARLTSGGNSGLLKLFPH
jgi:alkylhydroperoxidase family enzyme